jgi:hypothetical protein
LTNAEDGNSLESRFTGKAGWEALATVDLTGATVDSNGELSMIVGMMCIAIFTGKHNPFHHPADMRSRAVPSSVGYAPYHMERIQSHHVKHMAERFR